MKKVTSLLTVLFLSAVLLNCSHGMKKQNNDTLDYLNGNNYQTPGNGIPPQGIPIVSDHKGPVSIISGSLMMQSNTSIPDPVKYQSLRLMDGSKEVAKVMTDAAGKFTFTGYIPNGEYKVVINSKRLVVNEYLKIDEYKMSDITLFATVKK